MSVNLMSSVFNCNIPELKTDDGKTVPDTTAKSVLLAMADNANDEGEGSYPGVDTLCRKTNYSTSTVCNALNALRHNGFTTLVGRSRRDTNNYTISVAKILEFQWPKREDSSHRNASVSVVETNPLVTIHKPSTAINVPKIIAKANIAVDHVLENAQKSTTKTWTSLPEIYHSYGKAFCVSTGLSYHKRYFSDWASTFDEWTIDGYQPSDVSLAVDLCREKGSDISRPGSITWKLRSMVASRQPEPSVPNFTGAVDPDEPKYIPSPRLRAA